MVRENSAWPASFTAAFHDHARADISTPNPETEGGDAIARDVLGRYASDPFRGAQRRRVLEDGRQPSDLEVEAAERAIACAEVDRSRIGLVLVTSQMPDLLIPGNAALVHHRLGLRPSALALNVDTTCTGFLGSMMLAAPQIATGAADYALLVQSTVTSRCVDYSRPNSVNFGDGASAVVLGRVGDNRGILGWSWFNDGAYHRGAVLADPSGAPWYCAKKPLVATTLDAAGGREMVLKLGQLSNQAVEAALLDANLTKRQVDFFGVHQPTAWFNEFCRRTCSMMETTRTAQSFAETASVGPANLPFCIEAGTREGTLRAGDIAALFSCGSGMNWGALVVRWGR